MCKISYPDSYALWWMAIISCVTVRGVGRMTTIWSSCGRFFFVRGVVEEVDALCWGCAGGGVIGIGLRSFLCSFFCKGIISMRFDALLLSSSLCRNGWIGQ